MYKPRSKWHSAQKSNLANHGHKPLTTTRLSQSTQIQPEQQQKHAHTITITTSSENSESIILMIKEPQQSEIIEIPIVESMTSQQSNLSENSVLKRNQPSNNQNSIQNNQNNKNRTTFIQIPKQNSKPRIFLLTRPAKPQLVRIATPLVQHHHNQNNLNLSQGPHPQRITATNIASQTQSKIIRIPFLPRSQVKTFSVKSNQVLKKDPIVAPLEATQYPYLNRYITVQESQLENQNKQEYSIQDQQEATPNPITQQVNSTNRLSPYSSEISNQLQTKQSVKSTIPKSAVVTNLNLTENKTIQTPLTLASMAGIELTGADMSLSQADMSGAMPPTATVEEINVPVFIDEYLQQATASTTSVTTTNNNIFNINNNNTTNKNTNISNNNNESNGKGNEVNNCLDTFENFEFDIDLLTESASEDNQEDNQFVLLNQQQKQHLQHQQQQIQLTEVDDDKKLKNNIKQQQNSVNIEDNKKQLQLHLMLEEMLFNNSNKSNKNNNIVNTTNNNTNNNNIINTMAEEPENFDLFDLLSQDSLYKVAPNTEDFLGEDKDFLGLDMGNDIAMDIFNSENAINFTRVNEEISLNDCFINSQPNEVMFSSGLVLSQSVTSSQNYPTVRELSQEILEAEPTIPPEMIHYPTTSASAQIMQCGDLMTSENTVTSCTAEFCDDHTMDCQDSKSLINPLKRNGSQTSKHMQEKRLKLRLDTKRCRETDLPQYELNTPNVIKFILQNDQSMDVMGPAENSMDTIYHELISTSPQSASIKSEIIVDDTTNDFSPPNTPYSVNSISNQTNFTGFMNTAPNSPASSIATTTNTSMTAKRGRGRPAKLHSDIPDISQIQHLSETEQKKLLERAKNNEASRKSRLKHKERDEALEKEENILRLKNSELNRELQRIRRIEKKLQEALRVQHFQLKSHQ